MPEMAPAVDEMDMMMDEAPIQARAELQFFASPVRVAQPPVEDDIGEVGTLKEVMRVRRNFPEAWIWMDIDMGYISLYSCGGYCRGGWCWLCLRVLDHESDLVFSI